LTISAVGASAAGIRKIVNGNRYPSALSKHGQRRKQAERLKAHHRPSVFAKYSTMTLRRRNRRPRATILAQSRSSLLYSSAGSSLLIE
jgi:hypothetical protein